MKFKFLFSEEMKWESFFEKSKMFKHYFSVNITATEWMVRQWKNLQIYENFWYRFIPDFHITGLVQEE